MSDWISRKDKLPEVDTCIIAWNTCKGLKFLNKSSKEYNYAPRAEIMFFRRREDGKFYWRSLCDRSHTYFDLNKITHWKPLSEPPEVE